MAERYPAEPAVLGHNHVRTTAVHVVLRIYYEQRFIGSICASAFLTLGYASHRSLSKFIELGSSYSLRAHNTPTPIYTCHDQRRSCRKCQQSPNVKSFWPSIFWIRPKLLVTPSYSTFSRHGFDEVQFGRVFDQVSQLISDPLIANKEWHNPSRHAPHEDPIPGL